MPPDYSCRLPAPHPRRSVPTPKSYKTLPSQSRPPSNFTSSNTIFTPPKTSSLSSRPSPQQVWPPIHDHLPASPRVRLLRRRRLPPKRHRPRDYLRRPVVRSDLGPCLIFHCGFGSAVCHCDVRKFALLSSLHYPCPPPLLIRVY